MDMGRAALARQTYRHLRIRLSSPRPPCAVPAEHIHSLVRVADPHFVSQEGFAQRQSMSFLRRCVFPSEKPGGGCTGILGAS